MSAPAGPPRLQTALQQRHSVSQARGGRSGRDSRGRAPAEPARPCRWPPPWAQASPLPRAHRLPGPRPPPAGHPPCHRFQLPPLSAWGDSRGDTRVPEHGGTFPTQGIAQILPSLSRDQRSCPCPRVHGHIGLSLQQSPRSLHAAPTRAHPVPCLGTPRLCHLTHQGSSRGCPTPGLRPPPRTRAAGPGGLTCVLLVASRPGARHPLCSVATAP